MIIQISPLIIIHLLVHMKVGKNVNLNGNKLVVCKFYLIVHRFLVRVQSSTYTSYGKYLCESVMALLTPKSGIIEHAKFTYCSFSKAFFLKKKKNWRPMKKTSWTFKSFKTRGTSARPKINCRNFFKRDKNW